MRARTLKNDCAVSDEDPESANVGYEMAHTQRIFDCKFLPRLLIKEEMACNTATD